MTPSPVTLADRIEVVINGAIFSLFLFSIATLVHAMVARSNVRKRIQGAPIRWWIALNHFLGTCIGTLLADNASLMHEVLAGTSGLGLVSGVVIGNIHGAIRLARSPNQPAEDKGTSIADESDNPYAAPRLP